MRQYTFRLFGFTIFSWEVVNLEIVEPEAEETEDEDTPTEIGGGVTHNFAFDEAPYAPEDQFADTYPDDRRVKMGFRA